MRQLINKIALNNFDRIDGKMESDDVGLGLVSGRHHTLHHQSWFPQNHSRSSSASFPIWCSSLSWVEILITQEKENKTFAQKKRLGPKQLIWLSFGFKRWKMKWSLLQEHWSNKNSKTSWEHHISVNLNFCGEWTSVIGPSRNRAIKLWPLKIDI